MRHRILDAKLVDVLAKTTRRGIVTGTCQRRMWIGVEELGDAAERLQREVAFYETGDRL